MDNVHWTCMMLGLLGRLLNLNFLLSGEIHFHKAAYSQLELTVKHFL